MENVADALKMAGDVLLFVLAISVAIVSFGKVRQTSDIILNYKDRETEYIDGNYYYEAAGTERSVGLETVIPTVYRAYIENYKVVFEGLSAPLYKIKNSNNTEVSKYSLDLETSNISDYKNVTLANDEQKSEFLCGILYGDFSQIEGNSVTEKKQNFQSKFNISLTGCDSLYNQLKNKQILEYLGVYYQNDSKDVPDVNKTEKKIITYKVTK